NWLQLSPDWIVLILGFLTLLGTLVVLRYLPDYAVRFILWLLTHTLYRIRVVGGSTFHVAVRRCWFPIMSRSSMPFSSAPRCNASYVSCFFATITTTDG